MTALAIVVLMGFLLVQLQTRHVRRVAADRRGLLAGVQGVLEDAELSQRGIDYPVLTGVHRGAPVTVAVIVDTVTLRRLPTLWLSVTRMQPLPLTGPVDLLLRPSTTDIVSPGERFPTEHLAPSDWPAHLRVATPPDGTPDFQGLAPVLPLLREPRCKDVLLTPAGARVVTELARAEVGHYRLVKRAKFDARLDGEELTVFLDAVRDLAEGIRQSATVPRAARSSDGVQQ
jgi:hypothetical protein